jgi:branched-chain amino acid transport system substrate-binding protein
MLPVLHRRMAVMAVAVSLGLAACGQAPTTGSTGGGAAGSATTTSTSGTTASGAPVTIGLLAPLTGSRADLGKGMQEGAQLAVDDINANGGVLGHPVRLVVQDDAADPADAVPAAHQLIDVNHVVAIVGPTSITAGVVLPLAQQAQIPDLMFGGGSIFDHNQNPFFFRLSPSDSEQGQAMAVFAHSKGWNKIALAFGASGGSQALVQPVLDAAKALGMTVVANVTFTAGQSSYRSEIQKVFANKPDAVISQFNEQTAGVVFGELGQMGLLSTPWVGSNLWYTDTFVKSVGIKVATGPIYIVNSSTEGMLGATHFLQLLKDKYGLNTPPNGSEFMYDAVMVWALGADQAGTWKWPDIGTNGILQICCPPGTEVGDYATGYKLIQQHQKINWQGSASTDDFDQYDNVYGPFAVFHYKSDGSVEELVNLTAEQIQSALQGK